MNIKEAVEIAKKALLDVFEEADPNSFRLEEVVLDDFSDWKITLSYQIQSIKTNEGVNGLSLLAMALSKGRSYKIVMVNKHSGEVKAIKMYQNE